MQFFRLFCCLCAWMLGFRLFHCVQKHAQVPFPPLPLKQTSVLSVHKAFYLLAFVLCFHYISAALDPPFSHLHISHTSREDPLQLHLLKKPSIVTSFIVLWPFIHLCNCVRGSDSKWQGLFYTFLSEHIMQALLHSQLVVCHQSQLQMEFT